MGNRKISCPIGSPDDLSRQESRKETAIKVARFLATGLIDKYHVGVYLPVTKGTFHAMLSGYIRSGFVLAFAVMFGIVQLICPCLPDATSASPVPTSSPVVHQMSGMGGHHMSELSHHAMSDQDAPAHDHGEHDHQVDCSHCDSAVVLAFNADISPSAFTIASEYTPSFVMPDSVYRANMAGTNLAALRWLDPPRQLTNQTPVSLHTRSLI